MENLKFLQKNVIGMKLNYSNLNLHFNGILNGVKDKKTIIFFDLSCLYRYLFSKGIRDDEINSRRGGIEEELFTEHQIKDGKEIFKLSKAYVHEILNIIAHYRHYSCTRLQSPAIFYIYTSREIHTQGELFININNYLEDYLKFIPDTYIIKDFNNTKLIIKHLALMHSIDNKKENNIYINISKDEFINALLFSIVSNLNVIKYKSGIVINRYENMYSEYMDLFENVRYSHEIKKNMLKIIICYHFDSQFRIKRKNTRALMIKTHIENKQDLINSMSIENREKIINELESYKSNPLVDMIIKTTIKNWSNKLYDSTIFHINDTKPKALSDIQIDWLMNNNIQ